MWGAGSIGIVFAAWLVGRSGVWRTWLGRLRAAVYLLAYSYGRMLHSATQDWLHQRGPDGRRVSDVAEAIPFRLPGLYLEDYARPLLDLHMLLTYVWLFMPVFLFCRGVLSEKKLYVEKNASFRVTSLIAWTTIAAIILFWTRVLTWSSMPRTAYSHMPAMEAYEMLLGHLPRLVIVVLTVMLMVVAWSRLFWQALVAFFVVLLIDGLGTSIYLWCFEYFQFEFHKGSVLTGPALNRWSFIAGRTTVAWLAFGTASLLGVSFQRIARDGE